MPRIGDSSVVGFLADWRVLDLESFLLQFLLQFLHLGQLVYWMLCVVVVLECIFYCFVGLLF